VLQSKARTSLCRARCLPGNAPQMLRLPPRHRRLLSSSSPRLGREGGFTLIELLVTIAIAGVLMAVAAPSMTTMIGANRVQTELSSFTSDLQFARSEAIKQGLPITVCPASNGACLAANTWQAGWIVFSDVNGNGAVDSGESLRERPAFKGGDTLVAAPAPTGNTVVFNRDGFTSNLGTSTVTFKLHTAGNTAKSTRCVAVGIGGRLATQAKGEGACT
jgi:type IV fimbrial biogenesis protein FimT